MGRLDHRIKPNVIAIRPCVDRASEQVRNSVGLTWGDSDCIRRDERGTVMRMERNEVDRNQNYVVLIFRALGIQQDLLVVGVQKAQIEEFVERGIFAADL